MAGLGQNVNTNFTLVPVMDGTAVFDGQIVRIWFFSETPGGMGFMNDRTMPSAHIEPVEGELTRLYVENFGKIPHTIHLHGLDVDQANDGVPQTSFAIEPGEAHTYEFIAPHAGTYHYHCHVDTVIHYHKGMSGLVIVRPPDGSIHRAWDGGPTFDEEVAWHLHTFDMAWAGLTQSGAESARHRPNVFLLNGKQTADATADPYTQVNLAVGQRAYIRVLNSSYHWARVALGGLEFDVVATDGRPMLQVPTTDSWELGPGERYDLLLEAVKPSLVNATVDYLDDYTGKVRGQVATQIAIS